MSESIFPEKLTGGSYNSDGTPDDWIFCGGGLSKRELFAAMAMQGSIAPILEDRTFSGDHDQIRMSAINCVIWADYLIEALAKEPKA